MPERLTERQREALESLKFAFDELGGGRDAPQTVGELVEAIEKRGYTLVPVGCLEDAEAAAAALNADVTRFGRALEDIRDWEDPDEPGSCICLERSERARVALEGGDWNQRASDWPGWPEDWSFSVTRERPYQVEITKLGGGVITLKPEGNVTAADAKFICDRLRASDCPLKPMSEAPRDGTWILARVKGWRHPEPPRVLRWNECGLWVGWRGDGFATSDLEDWRELPEVT